MLTAQEKRTLWLEPYFKNKEYIDSRISQGIESNRKGNCRIKVADTAGIQVKITQKTHDFKYGAHIFMLDGFSNDEENQKFRQLFKEHFNLATVPFYWDCLEPEEGHPRYKIDSPKIYRRPAPDLCMDYCEKNGVEPKLHCLVYEKFLPEWLMKLPLEDVEQKYEERIAEIAKRYGGRMYEFEVINELLQAPLWKTKSAVSEKRDILDWAFKLAKKYLPNEKLVVNDGYMGLDIYGYRSQYFQLIENAMLKGIPIDKIGIQHHIFTGATTNTEEEYDAAVRRDATVYDPTAVLKALDMVGEFGLPIEITETTIPTLGTTEEDEQLQADVLKLWLSIWFSHPNVESVVYWNTVDYTAYSAPDWNENNCHGGLWNRDLTPKKSAIMLKKLFSEEWHTDLTLTTDKDGFIEFRGFYGDYEANINGNIIPFSLHK